MLLQALYEYAKHARKPCGELIISSPSFEAREVHWLIDLAEDGTCFGVVSTLDQGGKNGLLIKKAPRTLEPKDSGEVAEFLLDDLAAVFGLDETPSKSPSKSVQAKHNNFWKRIQDAQKDLNHPSLAAVIRWGEEMRRNGTPGFLTYEPFLASSRKMATPKNQWVLLTHGGIKRPLQHRPNVSIDFSFRVDGRTILDIPEIMDWWGRWVEGWIVGREKQCLKAHGTDRTCSVTGEFGSAISNSHLPKIKLRIENALGTGTSVVSAQGDSFHSYGLSVPKAKIPNSRSGPDASYSSVSVRGAIAYCDALNQLLGDEDHHFNIGPLAVCFWSRQNQNAAKWILKSLNEARPKQVKDWYKTVYAGLREDTGWKNEQLYSVALAGNGGRVVVRHWLSQPLESAAGNVKNWFDDLQIKEVYAGANGTSAPALGIPHLARITLRKTKKQKDGKLISDRIVLLYRAAVEGLSLPITMLQPILQEFQSAMLKDRDDEPTYPFGTSRFALVKLILLRDSKFRQKEKEFMPTYELSETTDPAYNCGRLLAVLENIQRRSLRVGADSASVNRPRRNAGVIERYYGRASTAPRQVFPILLKLSRHHLSKLQKGNESDRKAGYALEGHVAEIIAKLRSAGRSLDSPPEFPGLLSLRGQGVFAIGFYQQKAADQLGQRDHMIAESAEVSDGDPKELDDEGGSD